MNPPEVPKKDEPKPWGEGIKREQYWALLSEGKKMEDLEALGISLVQDHKQTLHEHLDRTHGRKQPNLLTVRGTKQAMEMAQERGVIEAFEIVQNS